MAKAGHLSLFEFQQKFTNGTACEAYLFQKCINIIIALIYVHFGLFGYRLIVDGVARKGHVAADRLKELRKEAHMTQNELANMLDMAKGTVAMWEMGKRNPGFEALEKMSEIFDRRVDYILGTSDKPASQN